MNEGAARDVLARLARAPVVLWRGDSLSGADIDLLVTEDWQRALSEASLAPRADGQWATADGDVLVDPLPAADWPRAYPPAGEVLARAERRDQRLPPVAAAGDRLAIFAADAVAGRSVTKLAPKMRAALAEAPGAGHGDPLLSIALDPDALEASARRDTLRWSRALRAAARSRRARHALVRRVRASAARRLPQKNR
jgi:hypothetical protein